VGRGANGIAIGAGSIWIASTSDGIVSRVDPTGVVTATIPVGHGPVGVAFGEGSLWVAVSLDGIVARIDPDTNAVVAVIDTGGRPRSVGVGVGAVWVADSGGRILRIDPSSSEITSTIHVGASPGAVAVVGGSLWTTVTALARKTTAIGARDATLRVEVEADPGVVDPAVSVNPQIDYATCAYLLNYPDVPAPAGSQLVPEVAESMPSVSRDGRSYTFGIRPGFRFSPPSNQPVTAQTFKDTIERTLDPRIDSEGASLLFDVVGAKAFNAGHARHIAGIVVDGDTLTIRLTRAVGDLPSRLAEPYFCAVPSGTPVDPDGVRDIPMAGPYYVASYVPGQQVVLERNPNYGGDRPEGPGHIDYAVGVSREHALAHVRSGQADYAGDGVPLSARSALRERFGPGSAAARAGHQQFFSNPALGLRYLVLNTQRPLFANVRLRRAVSYAIDRTALARIWNRYFEAGTLGGGSPSADYLPPGMRVSSMHVPYPLRADVKKARSLAGTKRREAVLFTCDEPPCPQQAAVIKADLRKIGIDVIVKAFPVGVMYARAAEPGAPYDLLRVGWGAEYTDPAAVLEPLFRGGSSSNFSQLDDPAVDRRLDAAAQLIGSRRARAYEELARWLAAEIAPIVVFENDSYRDFLSRRVGCHVFNPVYGVDLAALCLR
jgi:peptide/nickel transport system substrate-binding protein